MKILVLCYEYPPVGGGGAKVVEGLNSELLARNNEIDLVTMGFKGLPEFEKKKNLKIYRVPSIKKKLFVTTYLEIIFHLIVSFFFVFKLLKKNNYDFIHSHFILPDSIISYVMKKIFGIKYFITAHGSDIPGYNPDKFQIMHLFFKPLWKNIISNAEKVAYPSYNLLNLAEKVSLQKNYEIIPNGIKLNKFNPLREKKKKVLIVTRMLERKGVQYFLQALNNLKHDFEINIVGDGPYLETLKKIAVENNSGVKFWGHLNNKSQEFKDLFEESMIFVFTSESENFPIVLLEAMTAGMAIITTNGNGCAEVVGDCAELVSPKNSNEIKFALEKLIDDSDYCSRLGYLARKRVEENFSWNSVGAQYVKFFGDAKVTEDETPEIPESTFESEIL